MKGDGKKKKKIRLLNPQVIAFIFLCIFAVTAVFALPVFQEKSNAGISIKITFKAPIKVTFNSQGGKSTPSPKLVYYGKKYGTLKSPTKNGYKFLGWFSAKKYGVKIISTSVVTKKSNHTIYAHWEKIKTETKQAEEKTTTVKVNINTASQKSLETLNGIGSSYAKRIIEYRQKNGKFKKISEIKNVSGIGEKTYEKIKAYICV